MLSPTLRHILQLAKRTGDRVIVVDGQTDDAFVLMSVGAYEDVLGVTNAESAVQMPVEEPAVKANAEIAQWREQQVAEREIGEENFAENSEISAEDEDEEEDRFYIEPVA